MILEETPSKSTTNTPTNMSNTSSRLLLSVTSRSGMIFEVPKRSADPNVGSCPRYESEMMRIVPVRSSRPAVVNTTSSTSPHNTTLAACSSKKASIAWGLPLKRSWM